MRTAFVSAWALMGYPMAGHLARARQYEVAVLNNRTPVRGQETLGGLSTGARRPQASPRQWQAAELVAAVRRQRRRRAPGGERERCRR